MLRKLTTLAVKNAKPEDGKPRKLSDGGGLYLYVTRTNKSWRYNFRYQQKQKTMVLGAYPQLSLLKVRELHEKARERLLKGEDPSKEEQDIESTTFKQVAEEWYDMIQETWSTTHRIRCRRLLDQYLLPWLGNEPIAGLEPPDVLYVLKKMESQGIVSSMHKAKIICGQVLRYGVAKGVCQRDATADLKDALKAEKNTHFAALTDPEEIAELMKEIHVYHGNYLTREGLKLLAHTFVRSGELRGALKSEFDLDKKIWTIPAERMKNRIAHYVPLSNEVMCITRGLIEDYDSQFLLPSIKDNQKQMSENTLNAALRRMGYTKEQMTSHGFRAMASTQLNEMGYNPDAIEAQLAHVERNAIRKAYNRGLYWDERVKMMDEWSQYLTE